MTNRQNDEASLSRQTQRAISWWRRWEVIAVSTAAVATVAGTLLTWAPVTELASSAEGRQGPAWLSAGVVATTMALPVAAVSVVLAWEWLPRRRRARADGGEPTAGPPAVVGRIEEATQALQVTALLVSELEAEMKARKAALERLRAENDEVEKLAALRREEAEAVSRLIESVISSTHSRLGRSNRRDQILFFAAGLAASIPVQILANTLG